MTYPCGAPKPPKLNRDRVGDAALITGASSGLGRELAILFSKSQRVFDPNRSNHVILSGRNSVRLGDTKELCAEPPNTTWLCGDLNNTETCRQLVSFADLYSIKYLVLCAGLYQRGKFIEQASISISDILSSNTVATINFIREIFPYLQPGSTIVHINSMAGKNLSPEEAVYSASKTAMAAFLKAFRFEARDKGVRVLDVFPGAIQTPMCADRPGYDKMMDVKEVAQAIHAAATLKLSSLQIEELHLGRFKS